jgi:protein-disulfide isomerase
MKNPWVIIGILTVVLFGGALLLSGQSNERNNEGVTVTSHIKGNPDAEVTLVEFSDFSCPACRSFQPVLAEAMEQFGDRLSLEYKHFAFLGAASTQASLAAEAAGQQGKFFEYHDILFERQEQWARAATPQPFFIEYAEELELDIETFRRHMNSSLLRDKVRDDLSEGRERGVTGTPTFYLNGERMQVATFQDFIAQIALAVDPEAAAELIPDNEEVVGEDAGENVRFGL